MPVSTAYLDGDDELVSETLRCFFAKAWRPIMTQNKTPTFLSLYGKDTEPASDNELTANDLIVKDGDNVIRFLEAGSTEEAQNQSSLTTTTIHTTKIDIFGENHKLRDLFANQINQILFLTGPQSSNRIPKSTSTQENPENSGIALIKQNFINWTIVNRFIDVAIMPQMTGNIDAIKYHYK